MKIVLLLLSTACGLFAPAAFGNWTANLGYHNPTNATYGLNFLYLGSEFGFEVGIGWLDLDAIDTDDRRDEESRGDDTARGRVAGDIDLKYFFKGGSMRPYAQIGTGAFLGASAGKDTDAGADLGGLFYGVGALFGSPKFHAYLAGVLNTREDLLVQAGLGVDI